MAEGQSKETDALSPEEYWLQKQKARLVRERRHMSEDEFKRREEDLDRQCREIRMQREEAERKKREKTEAAERAVQALRDAKVARDKQMSVREDGAYEVQNEFESFQLGADERCLVNTNSRETRLNNNIMVVGGSGAGKTSSVVNPMLMRLEHSNAVALFTKKGMMQKIAAHLRNKGYQVDVIDFVNPKASKYAYDPLLYCENERDVRSLAKIIAHMNGMGGSDGSFKVDPFWDDSAEQLIDLVLRYVYNGYHGGKRTMLEALDLLDYMHQLEELFSSNDELLKDETTCKEIDDIYEEYRVAHPLHYALRYLKKLSPKDFPVWVDYNNGADKTSASITSTLRTSLTRIFQDEVRDIMGEDKNYDFRNLLLPHRVLFIYSSAANLAYHCFATLFYSQLFRKLFELGEREPSGELPRLVHVFCDDFATGAKIPNFQEMISIFREKRISATILLQSIAQLACMYDTLPAETIMDNCDTLIYMGGMNMRSNSEFSDRANLPLDEVSTMKVGEEIFFRRGQKPVVTKQFDFLHDPLYKEVERIDVGAGIDR